MFCFYKNNNINTTLLKNIFRSLPNLKFLVGLFLIFVW